MRLFDFYPLGVSSLSRLALKGEPLETIFYKRSGRRGPRAIRFSLKLTDACPHWGINLQTSSFSIFKIKKKGFGETFPRMGVGDSPLAKRIE